MLSRWASLESRVFQAFKRTKIESLLKVNESGRKAYFFLRFFRLIDLFTCSPLAVLCRKKGNKNSFAFTVCSVVDETKLKLKPIDWFDFDFYYGYSFIFWQIVVGFYLKRKKIAWPIDEPTAQMVKIRLNRESDVVCLCTHILHLGHSHWYRCRNWGNVCIDRHKYGDVKATRLDYMPNMWCMFRHTPTLWSTAAHAHTDERTCEGYCLNGDVNCVGYNA